MKHRSFIIFLCLMLFLSSFCVACGMPDGAAVRGESETGGDPFLGSWEAETTDGAETYITMDIWLDSDGSYHGQISIPQDESTVDYWEFSAERHGGSLKYADGKKTRILYEEENFEKEETIVTEDKGEIRVDKEKLIWKSAVEGQEITFV